MSRNGGFIPSWSPDGSELAFESDEALEFRVVSFDVVDGEPTIGLPVRKVALSSAMSWPMLSPRHDRLYYADVKQPGVLPPAKIMFGWQ